MTTHHHRFSPIPKLLTAGAVALAIVVAAAPAEAEAACGASAATVAAQTWTMFHAEAIALGCAAAGAIAGVDFSTCYSNANYYSMLATSMVGWWNEMVDNDWRTLGARELEYDRVMEGRVWSPDRLFCSAVPSDQVDVEIAIEKLDGKAKTEVEICKIRKDGSAVVAHAFTFDNGSDNVGEKETRTVTGAKDKIICVHLDNKSVTDSFQYKLDADK